MNKISTALLLLFSCVTFSQDISLQNKTNELKHKINQTQRGFKLKLLDSLSNLTRYKSEFNYDSIVKATIDLSLNLDSINLATEHSADFIFFLANRAEKPKEAIKVFDHFKQHDLSTANLNTKALLFLNGADGYFFAGQTKESIPYYKQAGEYALKAKDSTLLGKSKIYASDAYADSGQFAEASIILGEAEAIFQKNRDTLNLMTTRNSRANLYSRIGFFKEAEQVRNELIELAINRKDYRILQSTYYNMAIDNRKTDSKEDRILNLKSALKYAELGGYDSYQIRILISLLEAYSVNNRLDKAKDIIYTIKEHPLLPKDGGLDNYHYIEAQANYELALGNNVRALELGKTLLKLDSKNSFGNGMEIHKLLAKTYENVKNQKTSYTHFKIYSKIRDSINDIQNTRSLTYYQTLYETEKRDATIESQESKIILLDARLN